MTGVLKFRALKSSSIIIIYLVKKREFFFLLLLFKNKFSWDFKMISLLDDAAASRYLMPPRRYHFLIEIYY